MAKRKKTKKRPEPLMWFEGERVPISRVPPDKRPSLTYEERWLVSLYPPETLASMHPDVYEKHHGKKR